MKKFFSDNIHIIMIAIGVIAVMAFVKVNKKSTTDSAGADKTE